MKNADIIHAYFHGLERASLEEVTSLFSKDATVHSPLYGKVKADAFYAELFSDTQNSKIALQSIFQNIDNAFSAAAHFVYSWTMKDGSLTNFECIDLFELCPDTKKIISLTIIYDTFQTRPSFEKIHVPK